ncbi:MAG: hypothetical protein LUE64_04980 [Candidatus Gastranaerophilales bacterium]|nr:hypothetical protein [Candidatus Gastranaerophilales bacterium]
MQSVIGEREANFSKVSSLAEKFCKNFSPDIIVLPEVWTTGWYCPIFGCVKENDGKTEKFLSELAVKYNSNVIGGSYIKTGKNGEGKNFCPVFNRRGKLIAGYEKIHLYAPDGEAQNVQSGQNPVEISLEGLKIGLSICYDIRFPELFRSYINTENPPELLLNVSAWPLSRKAQYGSMAISRAIENQSYFLALSQTGEIKNGVYNAGNSLMVSPMGEIIQKLDEKENALCVQIDTDEVEKVRKTFPNLLNRKIFDFGFRPSYIGESINV